MKCFHTVGVIMVCLATALTAPRSAEAEPPPKEFAVIVFRGTDGRTLTMDELRGLTGTFQYEIVGGSNVPAEAKSLHSQAREAGGSGDYKKAIALLDRASKLAPQWPYPDYDMADLAHSYWGQAAEPLSVWRSGGEALAGPAPEAFI
jgi:hypothetical protein